MRVLLPLLALLTLAGCATPPVKPAHDPQSAWEHHEHQLRAVDHWKLSGRIAVIANGDGWHSNIDWSQQPAAYTIDLSGPMGAGAVRLHGDHSGVELHDGKGDVRFAHNPEELLAHQFGSPVPVNSLRYWVLGLPGPGEGEFKIDEYGLLSHLDTPFWQVDFRDYERHGMLILPSRIYAESKHAKVKLLISRWQHGAQTPSTKP